MASFIDKVFRKVLCAERVFHTNSRWLKRTAWVVNVVLENDLARKVASLL